MSLVYISCPRESQNVLLLFIGELTSITAFTEKMLQSCTPYKIPFVNVCAKDVPKLTCQTYRKLRVKSGKCSY